MGTRDQGELTQGVVSEAIQLAIEGKTERKDFRDRLQPYLVLRVSKHSASWLVKTRETSHKIGNVVPVEKAAKLPQRRRRTSKSGETFEFLNLRQARQAAKVKWAGLGSPTDSPEQKPVQGWTWGQVAKNYRDRLKEEREDSSGNIRYPSKNTENDLKIFDRPEIEKYNSTPISELNEEWLEDLCECLHQEYNFSAQKKFRSYANAALNLAQDYYRKESGLNGRKWWLAAAQRRRTEAEIIKRKEGKKNLEKRKKDFKVKHIGELLARHEEYCRSRFGNERVSPGVQWGLWWDCLVGHRRGSGTMIARCDVDFHPESYGELPKGWAIAKWTPEVMKTQQEFALPIPPIGVHIIHGCIRDNEELDRRAGRKVPSRWIFTSRVIGGDNGIIPVGGSAFANHIRNMRGLRGKNHRDILGEKFPHFNMHLIRSTLGDYILDETKLPAGYASLMIGHEIPGDVRDELDRITPTGKRWYFQSQRIPQKTKAMQTWSEALLKAFLDAGGLFPY